MRSYTVLLTQHPIQGNSTSQRETALLLYTCACARPLPDSSLKENALFSNLANLPFSSLTSMLHNLRHKLPILYIRPELLRHRRLRIILLLLLHGRQIHINTRTFTREDLRIQTILAQVDTRSIHLIQQNRRHLLQDLHRETRALDHVHGRDEGVEDERGLGGVVDGDCVCFAVDAESRAFAFGDEDGVVDFGVDFDRC